MSHREPYSLPRVILRPADASKSTHHPRVHPAHFYAYPRTGEGWRMGGHTLTSSDYHRECRPREQPHRAIIKQTAATEEHPSCNMRATPPSCTCTKHRGPHHEKARPTGGNEGNTFWPVLAPLARENSRTVLMPVRSAEMRDRADGRCISDFISLGPGWRCI